MSIMLANTIECRRTGTGEEKEKGGRVRGIVACLRRMSKIDLKCSRSRNKRTKHKCH